MTVQNTNDYNLITEAIYWKNSTGNFTNTLFLWDTNSSSDEAT